MNSITKKCTKCLEEKRLDEFYKNKNSKDGLTHTCKTCNKKQGNEWHKNNLDRSRERSRKYQAEHPKKEGYIDYLKRYYKENVEKYKEYRKRWSMENAEKKKETNKKWVSENKERVLEIKRKWRARNSETTKRKRIDRYLKNKEKELSNNKEWRNNNPEKMVAYSLTRRAKVKGNGGTITPKEWIDLKQYYKNTCLCCGRKEPEIKLELDHVVSIFTGGINDISNAQPLCHSCNASKGTKNTDYR